MQSWVFVSPLLLWFIFIGFMTRKRMLTHKGKEKKGKGNTLSWLFSCFRPEEVGNAEIRACASELLLRREDRNRDKNRNDDEHTKQTQRKRIDIIQSKTRKHEETFIQDNQATQHSFYRLFCFCLQSYSSLFLWMAQSKFELIFLPRWFSPSCFSLAYNSYLFMSDCLSSTSFHRIQPNRRRRDTRNNKSRVSSFLFLSYRTRKKSRKKRKLTYALPSVCLKRCRDEKMRKEEEYENTLQSHLFVLSSFLLMCDVHLSSRLTVQQNWHDMHEQSKICIFSTLFIFVWLRFQHLIKTELKWKTQDGRADKSVIFISIFFGAIHFIESECEERKREK